MVRGFLYPNQSFLCPIADADLSALLANQTQSPPQQGVQQPNQVQPPPFEVHPHYRHPTPSPSHQEEVSCLPSLHDEVEEEHHDNRFDQPNPNQLDYDVSTTSKNLRMDGSGSGSEQGGWRREGGWNVDGGGRVGGVWVGEGGWVECGWRREVGGGGRAVGVWGRVEGVWVEEGGWVECGWKREGE